MTEILRKPELVAKVANKAGLSTHDADEAVSCALEFITNALATGESIALIGFGTFTVKSRAAYSGRHPGSGETIEIASANRVVFRPGKKLKERLKN